MTPLPSERSLRESVQRPPGRQRRPAAQRPWRGVAFGMFAVGWGANQFSSLLVAYREERGISVAVNDALFGCYALALVAALLIGGPLADRYGRRPVVRPAVVLSLVASGLLIAGDHHVGLLYAGRIVAGVASGAIFAAGTAWVKELSTERYDPGAHEDSGARRAALSLSAGFGLGPLVTGVVAQWAPHPLVVAYLPHLVIALLAIAAVWTAPETATPGGVGLAQRLRVRGVGHPRFLGVVLPAAIWVFAAPSIAIAMLPTLVSAHLSGYAIVFGGVAAALALGSGVAIQPVARRLDRPGRVTGLLLSLAASAVGAVLGAVAAATGDPALALVAAVSLGVGYGVGLVSGLLETQRLARPDQLAGLTAVYYALTYVGFGLPLLLATLRPLASYPVMLSVVAAAMVACAGVVRLQPGTLRSESAAEVR